MKFTSSAFPKFRKCLPLPTSSPLLLPPIPRTRFSVNGVKSITLEVSGQSITFEPEDLLIETESAAGYACAESSGTLVALDTTLNDDLLEELLLPVGETATYEEMIKLTADKGASAASPKVQKENTPPKEKKNQGCVGKETARVQDPCSESKRMEEIILTRVSTLACAPTTIAKETFGP